MGLVVGPITPSRISLFAASENDAAQWICDFVEVIRERAGLWMRGGDYLINFGFFLIASFTIASA